MKKMCGIALAAIFVLSAAGAVAAADGIKVTVNNEVIDFSADQPPVIQNGRTLVPFRTVFEKLGSEVSWDDSTKTCKASYGGVDVSMQIDSTVVAVGDKTVVSDVPAQIINGRTMVPLRVFSESIGANVSWNNETKTVSITTLQSGSVQTAPSAVAAPISEEEAKNIAFENAGTDSSQASNAVVRLDREYSGDHYDVSFFVGNTEYEYEINAATGEIISMDKEIKDHVPNVPNNHSSHSKAPSVSAGNITAEQAKQIALGAVGVTEAQTRQLKTEYDIDDGREIYEVEFYVDRTEYSFEISASDGTILSREADND